LLERFGSDAQLVPEGVQAEQDGDGAQQAEMRSYVHQAHEATELQQYDTAKSSPVQSKPGIRGLASRIR
jgi:hypothetical protein